MAWMSGLALEEGCAVVELSGYGVPGILCIPQFGGQGFKEIDDRDIQVVDILFLV